MISPFDSPPFAPDPACPCCNKSWKDHPSLTQLCQERENLLLVAKSAAIQNQAISQTLMKVIGYIVETPQSPNSPKPSIPDLLDDMEL